MNGLIKLTSSWIFLGAIFLCSFFTKEEPLLGKWRNKRYGVEVMIYKKKELYFGLVTDAGNKKGNEKIKKSPLQVLKEFKRTSDSTYCCGQIFLPKIGVHVPASIRLNGPNNLVAEGFVMGLKTSSYWTKL